MADSVSRRRFLEAAAALAGVSLLGCKSDNQASGPPPGGPPPAAAGGPQAAANADGSLQLAGVGQLSKGQAAPFVLPGGDPGLLFQDTKGNYGAVAAKCTHAGCPVQWDPNEANPLVCHCHGSKFDTSGIPHAGPAKKPLQHYKVTISGSDVKLTPA